MRGARDLRGAADMHGATDLHGAADMRGAAVRVRLDDGPRLAGALLAAGAWPEQEQAARPYKPHRVAEAARRELSRWREHPAVRAASAMAGQPGEGGAAALFGAGFAGAWPADVAAHLDDFTMAAQLESLRARAQGDWEAAYADLSAVLGGADLSTFLRRLFGPELAPITVFPNLLYPGSESVTALTAKGWLLCLPPPLAWGTSPPWRYGERPDEVLAAAAEALAQGIARQTRPEAPAEVLGAAAAVLFLREAEGAAAADQFLLMTRRTRKLAGLAEAVANLAADLDAARD
jgi:hypothetical protein